MVVSKVAYEESRRKRLEENKKRMEELNLNKLAQSLKTSATPKPSPMKRVKPQMPRQRVDLSAVRRSRRVADKPPPSYKEEPIEPLGRRSYYRTYNYNPRDLSNRVYASHEDRVYAIERAEKLQSGLDPDIPSFVKPMLQSHVTGGFWLGLPAYFCNNHLPNHDEFFTLLDEDDNESSTKYLAEKTGLSAGWRGFAIDHELVDGDALVFQLIQPTKFKVYIIRVNQVEDSDETPNQVEDSGDVQNVTNVDIATRRTRASTLHTSSSSEAPNVTDIGIGTRRTRASKK
ncbi:B3 domain-containing protein [Camellia lanceoleosa]|uniref:B3 domain-containing protein n=1 Tax=Camellia lanceoleosa TaxID=1840588 RepID=A0ACC0HV81_9ERIC|nr:B3 domain-containing protein [Camellia lanceoleosa]